MPVKTESQICKWYHELLYKNERPSNEDFVKKVSEFTGEMLGDG